MAAGVHNLQGDSRVEQGTDWFLDLVISSGGSPVDITGFTFGAQIKKQYEDLTALQVITVAITDAVNGKLKLSLTDAETSALPIGKGVWDLEQVDVASDKTRLLEGIVEITPEVTT